MSPFLLFFILGILDKCPITVSFDSDVDCNKYEKILECTELLHEVEANAKEDAKSITGNLVTSGSCRSEPGCMAVLGEASIKNWYFFTFFQKGGGVLANPKNPYQKKTKVIKN